VELTRLLFGGGPRGRQPDNMTTSLARGAPQITTSSGASSPKTGLQAPTRESGALSENHHDTPAENHHMQILKTQKNISQSIPNPGVFYIDVRFVSERSPDPSRAGMQLDYQGEDEM
jgi:hypothetical protein